MCVCVCIGTSKLLRVRGVSCEECGYGSTSFCGIPHGAGISGLESFQDRKSQQFIREWVSEGDKDTKELLFINSLLRSTRFVYRISFSLLQNDRARRVSIICHHVQSLVFFVASWKNKWLQFLPAKVLKTLGRMPTSSRADWARLSNSGKPVYLNFSTLRCFWIQKFEIFHAPTNNHFVGMKFFYRSL